MARLDRLGAAKEVAQRAAVLGREFSYPLLAAVVAASARSALRQSLAPPRGEAEILFVRGEPPEATYAFKHALVQEAAYESLLKRTRQQLHGRVVDVLVEPFPERAAAEPELVARHAEAAGRIDDAIAFYQRAGERAQAHSAHEEAIRHFEQAIALLVTRPAAPGAATPARPRSSWRSPESRAVALGYGSPEVEARGRAGARLYESAGRRTQARGRAERARGVLEPLRTSRARRRARRPSARDRRADRRLGAPLRAHCDLGLVEVYRGRFAASSPTSKPPASSTAPTFTR